MSITLKNQEHLLMLEIFWIKIAPISLPFQMALKSNYTQMPNGVHLKIGTAIRLRASLEKSPDKSDDLITSDPEDWTNKWCVGGVYNPLRKVMIEVGKDGISAFTNR